MWISYFKSSMKVKPPLLKPYLNYSNLCILLDANIQIHELDIPVNAVATALKDFVSKRLPPLFEEDIMSELEDIAGKMFIFESCICTVT